MVAFNLLRFSIKLSRLKIILALFRVKISAHISGDDEARRKNSPKPPPENFAILSSLRSLKVINNAYEAT